MSETTPPSLAGQAHEAIRALNHRTLHAGEARGYRWPADVDATVAGLAQAVYALPQALGQAAAWLQRKGRRGLIRADFTGTGMDLPQALAGLAAAADIAAQLAAVLDDVHQHTAHLTGIDDDLEEG